MSRVDDLLLRVRDTLNDHDKTRWSDAALIRNLREGITDIAIQSRLFKNSIAIPIVSGQEIYQLPDNILEVSHCTYDWELRPLVSSRWMSANREPDWRYTIDNNGRITHFVFDEIKRREIRVYPRPFGDIEQEFTTIDSVYGVTTDITDYTLDTTYGVIGTIIDPEVDSESSNNLYGVLTGMSVSEAFIVYYTECPELPECVDDVLPLDKCFDTALKHYIVAQALRNDLDVQNRAMGNEEFVLYQRALTEISAIASTDSVEAAWFESNYNAIG